MSSSSIVLDDTKSSNVAEPDMNKVFDNSKLLESLQKIVMINLDMLDEMITRHRYGGYLLFRVYLDLVHHSQNTEEGNQCLASLSSILAVMGKDCDELERTRMLYSLDVTSSVSKGCDRCQIGLHSIQSEEGKYLEQCNRFIQIEAVYMKPFIQKQEEKKEKETES